MFTGSQQSGAAQDAANQQSDAYRQGITTTQQAGRDALAYLDPYRQFGLNAGASIEGALYSPEQRQAQMDQQRVQLQGEVDRLKALIPDWERYPVFSGKNASERRGQAFMEERNTALQRVAEAEAKLKTFDSQMALTNKQISSGVAGPQKIQESPWYTFQAELLGRNMDRFFAARGLTGSGFEAEERRRGLLELGAGETERQFGRMFSLFGSGLNASTAGAGAITGTSQGVANMQAGIGQAQAQGTIGTANAWGNAIGGASNAITGAVGAGLNYQMFNNLVNNNKNYSGLNLSGGNTGTVPPLPGGSY